MKKVSLIPAFDDNYIYLIRSGHHVSVVDPGDATPVIEFLKKENLQLDYILCTHHHADHIGGVTKLKEESGAEVIGPEDERIPEVETSLKEGDLFFPLGCQVFEVPGHTSIHLAFYFPEENWLFSGDALFAAGCGRLFEGTPKQMWNSLSKLMKLPEETEIYCGHEDTLENLEFAASLEAENEAVAKRLQEVKELRAANKPTIPSTLQEELLTNPFLRVNDPLLCKELKMENCLPEELFAEIRSRKDSF